MTAWGMTDGEEWPVSSAENEKNEMKMSAREGWAKYLRMRMPMQDECRAGARARMGGGAQLTLIGEPASGWRRQSDRIRPPAAG